MSVSLAQKGGWSRMAEHFFAGDRQPSGTCFKGQGARMGNVSYSGTLTIHSSPEGLYLSMWLPFRAGHPALFIPWDAIHNATVKKVLWSRWVEFEVGAPCLAKVQLDEKVFAGSPVVL